MQVRITWHWRRGFLHQRLLLASFSAATKVAQAKRALLRDFAGDLRGSKANVFCAVQQPFQKALVTGRTSQAAWRSAETLEA
jgi:hypothetical protein